eukprot:353284-Chlamydomonas_euryale.AAC.13
MQAWMFTTQVDVRGPPQSPGPTAQPPHPTPAPRSHSPAPTPHTSPKNPQPSARPGNASYLQHQHEHGRHALERVVHCNVKVQQAAQHHARVRSIHQRQRQQLEAPVDVNTALVGSSRGPKTLHGKQLLRLPDPTLLQSTRFKDRAWSAVA